MPDHDQSAGNTGIGEGLQEVGGQRATTDRMKNLRESGAHTCRFARSQNDCRNFPALSCSELPHKDLNPVSVW
ncbi:MAG: hypothetical protein OHK0029_37570 [Armatimonadaceae bacterium]